MSLQSRLNDLIAAIGTDIKDLRTKTASFGAFEVGLVSAFSVDSTVRVLTFSRTSTHAFDPANWWSTATGRHTPQKAGRWSYQCNIRFSSQPTVKIWPQIFKNGTLVAVGGPFYVGGVSTAGFNCVFPSVLMNGTTDYVEIKINADSGSWALSVDDTTNWISGHCIGN